MQSKGPLKRSKALRLAPTNKPNSARLKTVAGALKSAGFSTFAVRQLMYAPQPAKISSIYRRITERGQTC